MSTPWPVPVACIGPVEAGTLVWTYRGAVNVTLVLRMAYALAPGAPVPQAAIPVDVEDRHYQNDPARAVRSAADVAPRIPRAEIVHAGAVVAPAGVTVVRLAVSRAGQVVLDKRAVASATSDSTGLGPLGRRSAERLALLAGGREILPGEGGVLALPDAYEFGFHQCAPLDQRLDRWVGGDRILVGNLLPDVAEVVLTLPAQAPAARAALGPQEAPLGLECKRVTIDTDRRSFTLTWYGEIEIPSLEVVRFLRVEARAPEAPQVPSHPAHDPRAVLRTIAAAPPIAAAAPPPRHPPAGTLVLPPAAAKPAARSVDFTGTLVVEDPPKLGPTLPFVATQKAPEPRPGVPNVSATPWASARLAAPPKAVVDLASTIAIDGPPVASARLDVPPAPPPPVVTTPPVDVERPPVAPPAKEAVRSSPWAKQPEQAPDQAPPPARPAAPAQPQSPAAVLTSVRKGGYDRFKR